ncbi:MAG: hypothetical protein IJF29_03135 [Firmicutes bacterium]|nr:hypothetical protein [Bacillota bacterium]
MSYCPFCGEKIKEGGKCTGCGYTPSNGNSFSANGADHCDACGSGFGNEKSEYSIPLWLKIVLVLAMIFISGGTIIGIIVGAVLSTSKDPKYKAGGKWLLKAAIIVLVATLIISVLLFILFAIIGVAGTTFFISTPQPDINFTGLMTWIA